jgi:protein SSD1
MEQQQQQNNNLQPTGPGGRRLHIAHRRSPSELTPLMSMSISLHHQAEANKATQNPFRPQGSRGGGIDPAYHEACLQRSAVEQLALQQQIEMLQAQQQQMISAHQQYANMGLIPPGQAHLQQQGFNIQHQIPNISPQQQQGSFQFPQHQQGSAPQGAPTQPSAHRRNQSAMPGMSAAAGGPPPAPSSGAAGAFGEFSLGHSNSTGSGGAAPQRRPAGGPAGQGGAAPSGHQRRHSLALPEAIQAAQLAQAQRGQGNFQFPPPGAAATSGASPTSTPAPAGESSSPATTNSSVPATTTTPPINKPASLAPPRPGGRGGHGRSQSLAVMNGRNNNPVGGNRIGGFQFPPPMATNDAGAGAASSGQGGNQQGGNVERRGSNSGFQGHNRQGSRNYEGNWRNQNQNQNQQQGHQPVASVDLQNLQGMGFQPGHRARASIGAFSFPAQQGLMLPGPGQNIFMGQPILNPGLLQQQTLNQLQMQQAALNAQSMTLGQMGQVGGPNMSNQQQQQQRKTLFTPYLPQANLPALLADGQLVSGILRVNKKNRSDAYVSTQDGLLDADIFICGSKDRNRALEGDLVAVELLDVDEVWGQKREKEEKKKRKDISDTRGGPSNAPTSTSADTGANTDGVQEQTGGIKRRGSLRQRPTQKKNDDVEVEGQSLLLVEEEEVSDEQKPLFAGHIVAVIERVAGQMFSGYVMTSYIHGSVRI